MSHVDPSDTHHSIADPDLAAIARLDVQAGHAVDGPSSDPDGPDGLSTPDSSEDPTEGNGDTTGGKPGGPDLDEMTKTELRDYATEHLGVTLPSGWNLEKLREAVAGYSDASVASPPEPAANPHGNGGHSPRG